MAQRLQFPIHDLDKIHGSIMFQAFQQVPPAVDTSKFEAKNSTDNNSSGDQVKQFSTAIASAKINPSREVAGDSCILFLPPSIAIMDGVSLDNVDLGIVGAGLKNSISNGTSPIADIMKNFDQNKSSLIDAFRGNVNTDNARAMASQVASKFGSSIAGAVQGALATSPNPNTRMIFKAVNLREFSFDFRLMPKSEEEANRINNIIKFFRKSLYPRAINLEGTNPAIPIAYKFPDVFQITLNYNNKELNDNIRFQKMYMRTFSANYNPTQQSFYKGGHFQEVQITVNFVETRALTQEDLY